MYASNEEPEMQDYTSNNWSYWNSNNGLRKNLKATSGKNSIDSLQKTALRGMSHTIRTVLQWGSLVLQEKYQEEKACDKRQKKQQQQQQQQLLLLLLLLLQTK